MLLCLVNNKEIHHLAVEKSIRIDKEVVEYASKNLPLEERKEFEAFLRSMTEGNTIIVSSLSILSDKADELIKVINCVLTHEVDLWIANTGMLINKNTRMAEIFPLLNNLRDEGKEQSRQTGRPKGSQSTSKFDVYHAQIVSLLSQGLSVSAISRELEVSRSSLKDYIASRNIKRVGRRGRQVD
ncbi:MAG: recombinase family protein [Sulfurovum sp.]|nr:recombinase family protein [Sulfurovum sp.]